MEHQESLVVVAAADRQVKLVKATGIASNATITTSHGGQNANDATQAKMVLKEHQVVEVAEEASEVDVEEVVEVEEEVVVVLTEEAVVDVVETEVDVEDLENENHSEALKAKQSHLEIKRLRLTTK